MVLFNFAGQYALKEARCERGIMSDDSPKSQDMQKFVELLTAHQARIYSYILSLVPNFTEAEDIMQETSKMMWSRFEDFELGTNFPAWGMKIAYFRVLDYRKKHKKDHSFCFTTDVLQQIESDSRSHQDRSREYLMHLRQCLGKLTKKDKHMITMRYEQNLKVKDMAAFWDQSVQNIYQHLNRIHAVLHACVRRSAALEEEL